MNLDSNVYNTISYVIAKYVINKMLLYFVTPSKAEVKGDLYIYNYTYEECHNMIIIHLFNDVCSSFKVLILRTWRKLVSYLSMHRLKYQ